MPRLKSADRTEPRDIAPGEAPGIVFIDPAEREDRDRRVRCERKESRAPKTLRMRMALCREDGGKERSVSAGARGGGKIFAGMARGGDETEAGAEAGTEAASRAGQLIRPPMNAVSADLTRKRRIASDDQEHAARARQRAQPARKADPARRIIVPQDQRCALRQGTGNYCRVGSPPVRQKGEAERGRYARRRIEGRGRRC